MARPVPVPKPRSWVIQAWLSLAVERWQSVQPLVVPTEEVVWGKWGLKAWPE